MERMACVTVQAQEDLGVEALLIYGGDREPNGG